MWNKHFISDDAIIAMCNCHVPELLFIALHRYIEVSRISCVPPRKYWYFNEEDNLLTFLLP